MFRLLPDDSSQSMGACYAYCLDKKIYTQPLKNAYLGYEISKSKIEKDKKNFKKKIFDLQEQYFLKGCGSIKKK